MNPKDVVGKTKPPIGLIPPSALIEASLVAQHGNEKYGPFNWRDKPIEAMEYVNAILRHLLAFVDGETRDLESGRHHFAHIIQTAAIVIDAEACGTLIDNRPKAGPAAKLIRAAIKHPVESYDTTALHDDFGAVLAHRTLPAREPEGPVVGRVRRGEPQDSDR